MIFVFGSTLGGRHDKGAALYARKYHGAVYGIANGLTGNTYALPTRDYWFKALPLDTIREYVDQFIEYTILKPDLGFQVTRVGCGLAHYSDDQIAPMFTQAPADNVFFDIKWRPYLGEGYEYWGTF